MMSLAPKNPRSLAELCKDVVNKNAFENLRPEDPLSDHPSRFIAFYRFTMKNKDEWKELSDAVLRKNQHVSKSHKSRNKTQYDYAIHIDETNNLCLTIALPNFESVKDGGAALAGHIDLANKQPVLAAGEMNIDIAKTPVIVEVNNKSGHYQPKDRNNDAKAYNPTVF
jgi:hypothetical protein